MNIVYVVNITLRETPPRNFIAFNIKEGFNDYSIPHTRITVRRKESHFNNFIATFKLLNEEPTAEIEAIIWNNILDYRPIYVHAESYRLNA
jgi:hypothetical protein